jgi:hypothetical protein
VTTKSQAENLKKAFAEHDIPWPTSRGDLAEQLRERTALKYAADCKCGTCQLVPRALLDAAIKASSGEPT